MFAKFNHQLRFVVALSATILVGGSLLWISHAWAQQTVDRPDESELPGNERVRAEALPSESQLPDEPGTDGPSEQDDLPSEKVRPDEVEAANNDDPTIGALPGSIQPILRLAFEGHSGMIRTIDISDGGNTMVTAGEDKEVHVWRRTDVGKTGWLHRRTLRWPVTRADRGQILTATLRGDVVAFAGKGAYGGNGEIRLGDVASGQLAPSLVDKHRQAIYSLAWAPGEKRRLASVDLEGLTTLWQQDADTQLWGGTVLVQRDALNYDEATEVALRPFRNMIPLTFCGSNHVVVPHFTKMADGQALWVLNRINASTGASQKIEDVLHMGRLRDLDATADGRVLCSAGWDGTIAIWTFDGDQPGKARTFKSAEPALFIDIASDGKRLLVGTEDYDVLADKPVNAKIKMYDLEATPPKLISQRELAVSPVTGVWDSDQNEVIIAQGSGIEIHSLDDAGKFQDSDPTRITIPAKPVLKVAFARKSNPYQIAFGTGRDAEGKKTLDGVFDLSNSKLLGRGPINPDDYFSSQRTAEPWYVGPTEDQTGYQLFEGETRRGVLPLQKELHGEPTTMCTLPKPKTGAEEEGEKPETGAVIVGSDGRNGIYVYAADQTDPPRLLRHFRGHPGAVLSVSTSADGNYLASGGEDSMILIWNLQDVFTASELVNRWGVEFELDGNDLIAAEVREDGPLYFRGVREGDRLSGIDWTDNAGNLASETDAAKMLERLSTLPFDTMVEFSFKRFGRARPAFLSYAAWWPVAKLFIDQSREWAFWTPAGFYDASFNGHQRFGWQVNKGLDLAPDFFRAAQFRKLLERSDIMQSLLAAGSLPAAMRRAVGQAGAPQGQEAIVLQYQNKPRIELLTPTPGQEIKENRLTVQAKIKVPLGASLVDPRAFVSGVPAVSRKQIPTPDGEDDDALYYQWQFQLPSEKELQLEVLAATEAEALARILVDLKHTVEDGPKPRRMHVLAIGVSDYPDPQIPALDFAAKAARDVTTMFRDRSSAIYRVTTDELINADATRPLWRVFAQQAVEQLRESVSPDDLVIMYLCGHGMRDRRTNQWYFVTADTTYSDLMNDEYSTCIAFSDLAALAKLPCRKLAILDSCHSGAVQPLMERDDLKSALRFLQDDVVLTITASEGDEEAAEQKETRMGRFTTELRNGLLGNADADGNQTVTLNEVIQYVIDAVSRKSEAEGEVPQHPTASPRYLLRTLNLPLTTVAP